LLAAGDRDKRVRPLLEKEKRTNKINQETKLDIKRGRDSERKKGGLDDFGRDS
jgi:hypothetical protein